MHYQKTVSKVDVTGFDEHTLKDIHLGTAAAYVETTSGPVIIMAHHMAVMHKGTSIFCCGQIEYAGHSVDDRSQHLPNGKGAQCITLDDNTIILLSIRNGLAYMDMRPPTDKELKKY